MRRSPPPPRWPRPRRRWSRPGYPPPAAPPARSRQAMRTISRSRCRRRAAMKVVRSFGRRERRGQPLRQFLGRQRPGQMPLINQPLGECRIAGQALADEIAGGDRARQLRREVAAPRPRKSPSCPPRAGVSAVAHRMYRGRGSRARNCTGNSYCRCRARRLRFAHENPHRALRSLSSSPPCPGPARRLRQTRTGQRSRVGQGGAGAQSRAGNRLDR